MCASIPMERCATAKPAMTRGGPPSRGAIVSMTWSTLSIRLQRQFIGFLQRQACLIDGRWSVRLNEQRRMVSPQTLRYRGHRAKRKFLEQILDGALPAVLILLLSSRRMSLALLDYFVPT